MTVAYSAAGEFSDNATIQVATASAAIAKGDVCIITPASPPTVARCNNTDTSFNGSYGVAIEAVASAAEGRFVVKGEVGVDASGNCYQGQVVYGSGGDAAPRNLTTSAPLTRRQALGTVRVGAATGGICTVDVGAISGGV